jgi:hypothetical protein
MKKIISLYTITLFIVNIITAQADSLHVAKFQTDVINVYLDISKVSKENYFQILSKTAEYAFSDENQNYSKAILEISRSQNLTEAKALEKLFEETYAVLRKDFLWNSAVEISSIDKQILNVYNESLCPCISSKATKESLMQTVLQAQKECTLNLVSDTVFRNELLRVAGHNTLNDLSRLQRYLALLMYQNCELINYKFNSAILDNSVFTEYEQSISKRRRSESMKVLTLYEKNHIDSLKLIFPSYDKYIPLLKEAVKNKNLKKNTIDTYYYSRIINKSKPSSVIDIHDKDLIGMQLTFTFSEHALNSKITSVKIDRFEASKGQQKIMEVKEDVIIQSVKKN